jgi:hypothetical protein
MEMSIRSVLNTVGSAIYAVGSFFNGLGARIGKAASRVFKSIGDAFSRTPAPVVASATPPADAVRAQEVATPVLHGASAHQMAPTNASSSAGSKGSLRNGNRYDF